MNTHDWVVYMSSTYGKHIHLSIFGQSHGPAIGMTLDGIPAGLSVDFEKLQEFLDRRAPGNNTFSTARKEKDIPEFLSGIVNGYTCGAPISAVIYNQNSLILCIYLRHLLHLLLDFGPLSL